MQISLIGNPNCGKTTLFNALTGSRQHVGNWPGITVERKTGHYKYQQQDYDVVDLPGTYAIESAVAGVSADELIARNYVINQQDDLIINIVDATNLQRNLYLSFQLLDLNRPMIVVLNMIDALKNSGEIIDIPALQDALGCPVVPISARRGHGLKDLLQQIESSTQQQTAPQTKISTLSAEQELLLQECIGELPPDSALKSMNRWQIFDLLLNQDNSALLKQTEQEQLIKFRAKFAAWCDNEADIALASARYDAVDALCRKIIQRPRQASKSLTTRLDSLALGRFSGIPVFLLAIYLMFLLSVNVGSAFIDFFDILFGTIFVDGSAHLLNAIHAPDWIVAVLSNGLGGGIQTVSTFIPVIAAMFLCLSFLEDSGYLSRAAMVVDRGMRAIGLPGKAFVPMLIGFGCNVPAIMGTRTLESRRDRLMSMMMIPYMSCGARLPVYALLVAIFFPSNGHNIVFALYLGGIGIAVLTGLVLKHTLLPGAPTPFIMEMAPYRLPTMRNMLMLTWSRLKGFVIKAGRAIICMVMVLSFFNSLGTDGSFNNENTDKSVLSKVGHAITPAFNPMGIQDKNWPATVGLFTGVLAKETVIGTLNALYAQMGQTATAEQEPKPYQPIEGIKEAFVSIPNNLIALTDNITDPLNIDSKLDDGGKDVNNHAIGQIRIAFGSTSAAIAFLIFILLYTPCAAALGAAYREAGAKWTATIAIWSLVVAWTCATAFYQASQLSVTPLHAASWLTAIALVLLAIFIALRRYGAVSIKELKIKSAETKGGCCK